MMWIFVNFQIPTDEGCDTDGIPIAAVCQRMVLQWDLSVATTSIITFITCDLFSNVL